MSFSSSNKKKAGMSSKSAISELIKELKAEYDDKITKDDVIRAFESVAMDMGKNLMTLDSSDAQKIIIYSMTFPKCVDPYEDLETIRKIVPEPNEQLMDLINKAFKSAADVLSVYAAPTVRVSSHVGPEKQQKKEICVRRRSPF